MFKIFNFAGQRLGDKLACCYQLQYNSIHKGYEYILFDTSYEDLFPVKDLFPDIGHFVIETQSPQKLWTDLIEKYEQISFGNLWISTPSLRKDTGFTAKLILPQYLKNLQDNYRDETNKKVKDYKIKIINHCLLDAPYNRGRIHNREQWIRLIGRVKKYIVENNIDAVIVDIPTDYSMNVIQIMTLIEMGDLYIGGDTGFTHSFAMFNPDKPLVAIYGDDSHDKKAFEWERIKMECSSQWSSDPLSNNYFKYVMDKNLFNEEEVYNKIIEHINNLK